MVKRRQCKLCGKTANPTMLAAIGSALASSIRAGRGFRVYRCPHGNGWHLTRGLGRE